MNGFRNMAPGVIRFAALILLLTAVCAVVQAGPEVPRAPAGQVELVFFGVVTVRDGEYVLFQNPHLDGDTLEAAQRQLAATNLGRDRPVADEAAPLLDRVRHTLGIGDSFDLPKDPNKVKLVPYRFYAVSVDQPVSLSDVTIEPHPRLGVNTLKVEGETCVAVECWLPEDVEDVSFSAEYWLQDDYELIARVEGEQLTAGAAGRSVRGLKWRITELAELDNGVKIALETNMTPEAERVLIRTMTLEGEPMSSAARSHSRCTRPDEDRITHEIRFRFGDEEATSLGIVELCVPDPERVKKLSIRKFPVALKADEEEPEHDEHDAGSEPGDGDAD